MEEMAAFSASFVELQKNLQGFVIVLEYAACELFLNFLLLLDAVFSYLLTKYARYCKLQIPCILCSRLDHVLGGEKPGFYCNLLCNNHRSEISSMFSCCIHESLADGDSMCEGCILSSGRKSKPNRYTDRLLMGRSGLDLRAHDCKSSPVKSEFIPSSMGEMLCSCCNKPRKTRQNADKPHLLKPQRRGLTMPNIPLPRHLTYREGLKKMKERFSGSATTHRLGKISFDPLSNLGYKELNVTSDSESDFPFSDSNEGRSIGRRMKEPREVPPITLTNFFHFDANMDRAQGQKTYTSALPELISLDDFPILSHVTESTEQCEGKFHVSQKINSPGLSELMSLVDAPSSLKGVKGPLESSQWQLADGTGKSKSRLEEILNSVTTPGGSAKLDQIANEVPAINPTFIDRTRESKELEGHEEDAKSLPSEKTSPQGVSLIPDKRISISHQGQGYELQIIDPSSSNASQMLQETISMEPGVESIDGSSISEIEGEGEKIVDRLKRQISHDRKCINILYKELEEERNATAIAANQAMAMITRLQEEKASFHMEALHYLRVMEEQAEYDVEALEKANDLLAEKEREIQDMEAEIEYFRLQLDEPVVRTTPGRSCDPKGQSTSLDNASTNYAENNVNVQNSIDIKSSWSEFEDEKLFISQWLKDLEKKFHQFAHQDSDSDVETVGDEGVNKEESPENVESHEKSNNASVEDDQISSGQKSSKQYKEIDLVNLNNEISDLNERLEALESDWNFLEHTFNSLQNGEEGLQMLQEIAHRLQELRKCATRP